MNELIISGLSHADSASQVGNLQLNGNQVLAAQEFLPETKSPLTLTSRRSLTPRMLQELEKSNRSPLLPRVDSSALSRKIDEIIRPGKIIV